MYNLNEAYWARNRIVRHLVDAGQPMSVRNLAADLRLSPSTVRRAIRKAHGLNQVVLEVVKEGEQGPPKRLYKAAP